MHVKHPFRVLFLYEKRGEDMTRINLSLTDQLLTITEQPKVAAGDQNSVTLTVEFSAEWDDFITRKAVFYTSNNATVYGVILVDGSCIIPHEVLDKEGTLFIGIRGENTADEAVKTSTLVKYKIDEGAPPSDGEMVDPTATEYQQIIALMEESRDIAQSVRDDFEAGAIPALQEQNKKAGFMFWVGTKAEYAAQKDSLPENTFCVITDDTSKDEILRNLEILKIVPLGSLPINKYVHSYDYFVVYMNGKKLIFNDLTSDSDTLDLYARCYTADANNTYLYQLHFYWGDGGYMCDATTRMTTATGSVMNYPLAYTAIYGGNFIKMDTEGQG